MKSNFAFGQPINGIVQMAYMVQDIHQAMADWSSLYGVGPFFLNENYVGDNSLYRGKSDNTAIDVAMGYSGHMQIELIQVKTKAPSVYHEGIERFGYGFHHVGIVAQDFDRDLESWQQKGFDIVMSGNIKDTSLSYAYLEKPDSFPGYMELIPPAIVSAMMIPMYRASVGWSGKEPVRRMK